MIIPARSFDSVQPRTSQVQTICWWTAVYALVSYFTGAYFMADTVDYVASVYNHDFGKGNSLFEFGHLFWRPIAWGLLHTAGPLIQSFTGADSKTQLTYLLMSVNWLAGLICILLLLGVLRRFLIRPMIANLAALALLFSNAFLNYIHSGTPYIPALAFLLFGFYLLTAPAQPLRSPLRPFWAACALALSVCLWFPYIFAIPGALAIPLFHQSDNHGWSVTLRTTIYCLILGIASYGVVLASLHILTPVGMYQWITAESSAIGGVRGLTRAIFGFARSFLYMGDDGVLFKRFLLHDPYNPVKILDLVRASLAKLFLFYVLILIMIKQLLGPAKREALWLFLLTTVPVLLFALFWYGGDMERYLPLYPTFFVCLACSVDDDRAPRRVKGIALAFLIVTIFSTLGATSIFKIRKEERHADARLKDLLPMLKPGSRLLLSDIHDELENFGRTFPFDPIVRTHLIRTYPVINPGTAQTLHWRHDLGRVVISTWNSNDDVWVSKRISEPRPQADWKWVEGEDPRVSWSILRSSFAQLEYGTSVGGNDGFILLLPTQSNKYIINSFESDGSRPTF